MKCLSSDWEIMTNFNSIDIAIAFSIKSSPVRKGLPGLVTIGRLIVGTPGLVGSSLKSFTQPLYVIDFILRICIDENVRWHDTGT